MTIFFKWSGGLKHLVSGFTTLGMALFIALFIVSCTTSEPDEPPPPPTIPISGTIGYDDQTLTTGYDGTVDVALTNSDNFTSGGGGTITFTAVASPAIPGLTVATDGTVTIPSGVSSGDYEVTVSVSSSAGGTVPNATFRLRVQDPVPISGTIGYADQTLVEGYTGTPQVALTNSANFTPGNGRVIFTASNDMIGGLTASENGTVTIPSGVSSGDYEVTVSVSSSTGGDVADATFNLSVQDPVSIGGTIGYGDRDLTTGYAGTVDVALTTPANFTPGNGRVTFSATAEPEIAGLTVATDGTVTIPNGVGRQTYTVTVSVSSSVGGDVADATFRLRVQDPISGSIGYAAQTLVQGYAGTLDVALTNSANFTAGDGRVSFTATARPGINGLTTSENGTVTIPSGVSSGDYELTVSVSGSAGGDVADATFRLTVQTPIGGAIGYDDIILALGYAETNVSLNNPDALVRGDGEVSFMVDPPTIGAQSLMVNNNGVVTIPAGIGLTSSPISVRVTAESTVGEATPSDTFTLRVVTPVSGTFTYPTANVPAASRVVVGSQGPAVTISPDLSRLNNYIGFTIAPTTPGVDIGGVTVDSSGVISISNSTRVGSAEYTVTAYQASLGQSITANVTIKNSYQFNFSDFTTSITYIENGSLLKPDGSRDTFLTSSEFGYLIDNSANAYNFAGNDILTYAYANEPNNDTVAYDSSANTLTLGTSRSNNDSAYGLALNPNLLISGDYNFIVNVSRSSGLTTSTLGYQVSLSDGTNITPVTTNSRVATSGSSGATEIIQTTARDITSGFTYDGSTANRDNTLTVYFSSGSTSGNGLLRLIISSITIVAQ